ncbi:DUF6171 family protein [Shouchella patagoniensis]|uniref:DUF6171 family protein n=1 Tax=Shouchella patagoniensis TaxID=228576 RepID=UPI000994FB01|nr:DUF6171 family protein [Shouchella patagoniensis]
MSCKKCPELRNKRVVKEIIQEQLVLESDLASDTVFASRLAICASCEHLIDRHTCAICGCYVEFRARLAYKRCPLKKGW